MTASPLTPLIVSAEPLLRAIKAGGHDSLKALAETAGRLPNHIHRDLKALIEAALIERPAGAPAHAPRLTPTGEAGLAALDRAAGAGADEDEDPSGVRWDQLLENPDNPRKIFDEGEIAALAETIADKGLLQPILLRSDGPGPDGSWVVEAGERRRRAIGLLVADGRWEADRPVPVRISGSLDEGDVLENALIENLQRADMAWIDEALAFRELKETHGRSTAQIARLIGSPNKQRMVQQYIQVAGRMSEDQVRRARLPRYLPEGGQNPQWLGFKEALAEVQEKREPAAPPARRDWDAERRAETRGTCEGLPDKTLLALIEVADKCLREPARRWGRFATLVGDTDGDPTGLRRLMPGPLSGGWGSGPAPEGGGREEAIILDEDVREWLAEQGYIDDQGATEPRLGLLRQKVAGIGAEARLRAEGRYWTPWLNLDGAAEAAAAQPTPARAPSGPSAPPDRKPFVEPQGGAREHLAGICRRLDVEKVSPAGWGRLILGRLPDDLEKGLQADGAIVCAQDQRHGWTVELTEAAKRWWAAQPEQAAGKAADGDDADTDAWDRTPDQVEADRQLLADARALNQGAPWSDKAAGFRALLERMGLAIEGGFDVHPDDPCTIILGLEGADPARIFPVVTVDQHSEWPDERAEALTTLLVGALNRALRGRDPAKPAGATDEGDA